MYPPKSKIKIPLESTPPQRLAPSGRQGGVLFRLWGVTFIPMPMPNTVCITFSYNKWVQSEVCRTLFGRGMGMNITAQTLLCHCMVFRLCGAYRCCAAWG